MYVLPAEASNAARLPLFDHHNSKLSMNPDNVIPGHGLGSPGFLAIGRGRRHCSSLCGLLMWASMLLSRSDMLAVLPVRHCPVLHTICTLLVLSCELTLAVASDWS